MLAKRKKKFGQVVIIVGMQYGSEGKGSVAEYLAPIVSMGLRSGAANAGHTIYYRDHKFVMRQIPAVWVNRRAKLIVSIGAMISLDVLLREIEEIDAILPIKERLFVDYRAHVVTVGQIARERRTDLAERIGSTSATANEGIGVAMADKILRKVSCAQAKDIPELQPYLADTVTMANECLDRDEIILLEGTQGFNLSLEHGYFPYVTSRDTSATALAASTGIATHEFDVSVIGVVRTHPIRVAGNSGPFDPDSRELTWEEVTERAGATEQIAERTSVTGKIRRVATFSIQGFKNACLVNRPTEIALTFGDYLDWSVHEKAEVSEPAQQFMDSIEGVSDAPITLLKTGAKTILDFDSYRANILSRIGD